MPNLLSWVEEPAFLLATILEKGGCDFPMKSFSKMKSRNKMELLSCPCYGGLQLMSILTELILQVSTYGYLFPHNFSIVIKYILRAKILSRSWRKSNLSLISVLKALNHVGVLWPKLYVSDVMILFSSNIWVLSYVLSWKQGILKIFYFHLFSRV